MLNLFRKEKPYEQESRAVYAKCLNTARNPAFITEYGLPDEMDTRFELLTLHAILIMLRTLGEPGFPAQPFNQTLFDTLFIDMEQTLREMGIGDMGIPKRMKKMMTGFNGRLHAYETALSDTKNAQLTEALSRNVTAETTPKNAKKLAKYVRAQQKHLATMSINTMLTAESLFTDDNE